LFCVFVATAQIASAQGPVSEPVSTARLLDRIELLEQRIAELEARLDADQVAHPAPAAVVQPVAAAVVRFAPAASNHDHDAAIPSIAARPAPQQEPAAPQEETYPSLKIRGFTDVNFSRTDETGNPGGFNLGQFVLHFSSPLSRKVSVFGETSFTARTDGFSLEVERSIIRYDYNDLLKVSFGRFHTPIGYWNTAFHHGSWLQTTISRPEMIQFGGRYEPVHFVGAIAEGAQSGGWGLGYSAGVGNGRGLLINRAGDAGDVNSRLAWTANLFARPTEIDRLKVGGGIYSDRITRTGQADLDELILSAHTVWTSETPEVLAEISNVRHKDQITGIVFNSPAYYVQFAYRVPQFERRWKPYYRFEKIGIGTDEPVLQGLFLVSSTAGIRVEVSDFSAVKAEYRRYRRSEAGPHINGLFLQTDFTF
jgi:hypothetical protein